MKDQVTHNMNRASKEFKIPEKNILEIIDKALKATQETKLSAASSGKIHSKRSRKWVISLGKAFLVYYRVKDPQHRIRSFYRDAANSDQKEFLFDISIGVCESFNTKFNRKQIYYISEPLWQIESEFAENTREITNDFSKLISGIAPYKMMIGSPGKIDHRYFLNEMSRLAHYVRGDLYYLILTHPREWMKAQVSIDPHLFKWIYNQWIPVNKSH